jgi:hypothetical protein
MAVITKQALVKNSRIIAPCVRRRPGLTRGRFAL